jgi:hypothetical protein
VGGTFGAVTRAIAVAIAWGVVLAACYGAPLLHGAWIGLWAWGPGIVLGARWRTEPAPDVPADAF